MASTVRFDPSLPDFLDDPYPFYQRLRETDPVHWEPAPASRWVLTRYADVTAALRDPRLAKAGAEPLLNDVPPAVRADVAWLERSVDDQIDSINPPKHTRLRRLLNRGFTPELVAARQPRIQQVVDELLDAVAARGQMDLIADFTFPLPAIVIMEVLGIPREEREQLRRWSGDYAALMGHGGLGADPGLAARRANESMQEFSAYLRGIVVARRQAPRDDLISALLAVEEQGDTLSEDELITNCRLLLIAGNETTTNLVGNGMLALLQQLDQLAALRADPTLVVSAIEEFLRYDAPAQMVFRWAAEDFTLDGKAIRKGQMVVMVIGAANRDPAQFPNPDALDVRRHPNEHHAFGFGTHFCPGSPLARLEARLAVTTLLRRLPDLARAGAPVRNGNPVLRGLQSLPVRWTPADSR
jgi:cytochrome P450